MYLNREDQIVGGIMKKGLLFLLTLLLFSPSDLRAQSPVVRQIIDSVSIDSLNYVVKELSGEVQTVIDGTPQTILSRHRDQPGNALAERYIMRKLQSYGLPTTVQTFSATGRNVLAIQVGTVYPNRKFVFSAHYDDMPEGPVAPGADDPATAVAVVLEAARIFSRHSFPFTIVYGLWDEEETYPYLTGSLYFADHAAAAGDSILGSVYMDMLGWDANGDGLCYVQELDRVGLVQIRNHMVEINSQYGIGLNVRGWPATSDADQAAFWYNGFDGVGFFEDAWNDRNTTYHTINDRVQYLNQPYYLKMAKLAMGTLAFLALHLNFDIAHAPMPTVAPPGAVSTSMSLYTGMDVGTGSRAPRMYYRTRAPDGPYGQFLQVPGVPAGSGKYSWDIPALSSGTEVQYYLAAQDQNSTVVTTSPPGGNGFDPPGSVAPTTFHQFLVGNLTTVWSDEANDLTNWQATGSWNTTAEQYVSSPTSFTDSPGQNYALNSNSTLTCTDKFPLQTSRRTYLEFDTRWALSYAIDNGQVEVSVGNGSTWSPWTPVAGQYTYLGKPAPWGPLWQYPSSPIYGGVQRTWVHEIIDISDYASQPFRFRFRIYSDEWYQMDGWYIDNVKLSVLPATSAQNDPQLPSMFSLGQNYPNPFNPSTTIKYDMPKASMVRLTVHDILGREVSALVSGKKDAGTHEARFDAVGIPSGVYLYRLIAGSFVQTRKMIVVK
jgi:hypothetical protein